MSSLAPGDISCCPLPSGYWVSPLFPGGLPHPQHEGAWSPSTRHMLPLLPGPCLARAPWPWPRNQGKWAATVVLLLLLPGDKIFAESRVWYSRGPSLLAFLPHPYLLGTPTLPGVVGKGLVFPIQRQNIRHRKPFPEHSDGLQGPQDWPGSSHMEGYHGWLLKQQPGSCPRGS